MTPGWWVDEPAPGPVVSGAEDAIARLGWLREMRQEACGLVVVDGRGRLVGSGAVSLGTVDHTFMSPFEIIARVLATPGGAGGWVAHNHPSGDPTPSDEDGAVWRRLTSAARKVGVRLHDSLVVAGHEGWWSLRAGHGLVPAAGRPAVTTPEAAVALVAGRELEPGTVEVLACDLRHRLLDATSYRTDQPGWPKQIEARVLRQALAHNAPALVVVAHVADHRRPADGLVDAANRLETAGATLGVRVLDVIARSDTGWTSLARRSQLAASLTTTLPRRASHPLPPPPPRPQPAPAGKAVAR